LIIGAAPLGAFELRGRGFLGDSRPRWCYHEFPVVAGHLAVLAAAVLAAANVLAVVPALLAARSRPGQALRAE